MAQLTPKYFVPPHPLGPLVLPQTLRGFCASEPFLPADRDRDERSHVNRDTSAGASEPTVSNEISHTYAGVIVQAGSIGGDLNIGGGSGGTVIRARIATRMRKYLSRPKVARRLRPLLRDGAIFAVVTGPPGIGKTSLVVQWVRRNGSRFGSAQLYLDLNGYGVGPSVTPRDLTRLLLLQLGIPSSAIPNDEPARLAVCRARLSEGDNLVILDNAESEEQVRALLAPFPPCAIVITSRDSLEPLVAKGGVRVPVPPFTDKESSEFIGDRLGANWLDADEAAARRIVEVCAGVPLALSILVARAELDALTAADVASELQSTGGVLGFLDLGDAHHGLSVVYSWSLRRLTPTARRVFAFIGLLGAGSVTHGVVCAGLSVSRSAARSALLELRRANLIDPISSRGFATHDLTLEVARATMAEVLTPGDFAGVRRATLEHLAAMAYQCDRMLYPKRADIPIGPIDTMSLDVEDYRSAFRWFDDTIAILLAVFESDSVPNDSRLDVWRMCWSLTTYLDRTGRWDEYARSQRVAVRIAEDIGDTRFLAVSERLLATALSRLGQHSAARDALQSSLSHTQEGRETARTTLAISFVDGMERRHDDALRRAEAAFELYRGIEDDVGSARALSFVVAFRTMIDPGHPANARDIVWAIDSLRASGNLWETGHALYHQGLLLKAQRAYPAALDAFAASAEVFRSTEDRFLEARAWVALGDVSAAMSAGTTEREEYWALAESLLAPFGAVFTDVVRRRRDGEDPGLVGALPSPHPVA